MRKLALLLPLLLTACETTSQIITSKEQVVISVPSSMYICNTDVYIPKAETLTDVQVAKLLSSLQKNNKICKNSLNSIKKYLDQAKETVDKPNS